MADNTASAAWPGTWRYGGPLGHGHWIIAGDWQGPEIAALRHEVELLTSREEIERWIGHAVDIGIDPL